MYFTTHCNPLVLMVNTNALHNMAIGYFRNTSTPAAE